MLFRDDQIRISQSQSSVHVWGSWHAEQRVWHHTSILSLNRKKNKMAPQIELHGAYIVSSEILCSLEFSLPTGASLHKEAVGCVVQLCSKQPLRLFSIISFIETAAQLNCSVLITC